VGFFDTLGDLLGGIGRGVGNVLTGPFGPAIAGTIGDIVLRETTSRRDRESGLASLVGTPGFRQQEAEEEFARTFRAAQKASVGGDITVRVVPQAQGRGVNTVPSFPGSAAGLPISSAGGPGFISPGQAAEARMFGGLTNQFIGAGAIGPVLGGAARALPSIIRGVGGILAGKEVIDIVRGGGNGGGFSMPSLPSGGACAPSAPFKAGCNGATAVATTFMVCNPVSGKQTWFKPAGRPILWSSDLAACKRVGKVASKARRVKR
jgi:hypothetical protein